VFLLFFHFSPYFSYCFIFYFLYVSYDF